MSDSLDARLAKRAVGDIEDAVKALTVAALQLPHGSRSASSVADLARQLVRLVPLIEKELRGECYVCRCCGAESFSPFGSDETICGPCHNGIHHDHAPTASVAAENKKKWGQLVTT